MPPDSPSSTDGAGRPWPEFDASNAVRLCDRCEDEQGVGAGGDKGDRACSACGQRSTPHVYPSLALLQASRERTRVLEEALKRADALLLRFAEMDAFNVWSTYWKNEIAEVRESLAAVAVEDGGNDLGYERPLAAGGAAREGTDAVLGPSCGRCGKTMLLPVTERDSEGAALAVSIVGVEGWTFTDEGWYCPAHSEAAGTLAAEPPIKKEVGGRD